MASKTPYASEESKQHQMEYESAVPGLCECPGKVCPERTNGSMSLKGNSNDHTCREVHLAASSKDKANRANVERLADGSSSGLRLFSNVDGNTCFHGDSERRDGCNSVELQEYTNLQRNGTLQDLYIQEEYDDEEDDSDWEPMSNHFSIRKWFCTNCTMPNFEDVSHCEICGEDKDSELCRFDTSRYHIGKEAQISGNLDAVQSLQGSSSSSITAIGFDERMLLHFEVEAKPHPHPERPDRLRAIASSFAAAGIFPGKCSLIPAREIKKEELQLVHTSDHVEAVQQTSNMLYSYFTSDTYANEHSACAARLAAGLCADLARTIMSGSIKNGFALVRPPGHHAGIKHAMGFCLHNNAAVAALAAQSAGAKKVLIVDWDVHHGNGTQEIFDGNKSQGKEQKGIAGLAHSAKWTSMVLYISLHRHEDGRFYPGTGAVNEVGTMDGKGFSVNIPWSCGGVGDNDYIYAFKHVVLPIASDFNPDITIVSAGFDAARGDPLGCCDVTPNGYAHMTNMLTALSDGRLLVILEGGYNLRSISTSATAVVKVLLGENSSLDVTKVLPSKEGLETLLQVLQVQMQYWPILQSSYLALQSHWSSMATSNRDQMKKRRRLIGPLWWRWGSKRLMYELLYGRHRRTKGRAQVN